jgi:membrane protease YdiL (CAAX protease family)
MDGQREVGRWPLAGIAIVGSMLILPLLITIIITAIVPNPVSSGPGSNGWSLLGQYLLPFLFLISATVVLARATIHTRERRQLFPSDLGYQRWFSATNLGWFALAVLAWFGINLIVGVLVQLSHGHMSTIVAASGQTPLINSASPGIDRLLTALVGIVCAPICEELVFRGGAYRCLRSRLPIFPAALIGGACFGLAHMATSAVWVMGILALDGLVLCLLFERTRSLFPGMLLHSFINTLAVTPEVHSFAYQAGCFLVFLAIAIIAAPIIISRREDRVRGPALPLPAQLQPTTT